MYCPNCGKEISESVHFCPYCGTKVFQEIDEPSLPKKRPQKRVDESVEEIEDDDDRVAVASEAVASEEEFDDTTPSERSFPNITIGIYLLLNFVLKGMSPYSEEIMGIFIYTWIVLAIIFIRRNKENPFNWFLNIFIFLQAVLVFVTGMMIAEYLDAGGDSIEAVVQLGVLTVLFITIIVLLIKGNGVKNSRRASS